MAFLDQSNETFDEALDELIENWGGLETRDDIIASLEAKIESMKGNPDAIDPA